MFFMTDKESVEEQLSRFLKAITVTHQRWHTFLGKVGKPEIYDTHTVTIDNTFNSIVKAHNAIANQPPEVKNTLIGMGDKYLNAWQALDQGINEVIKNHK